MLEIKKLNLANEQKVLKFKENKTEIHLLNDISTSLLSRNEFLSKFGKNNFFAKDKNNFIGYIIYDILKEGGRKYCLIYGIHLSKEVRGKGIGSKLMKKVLEEMRNKKVKKIVLDVSKKNKKAQKFYKKFGFEIDSYRMVLK